MAEISRRTLLSRTAVLAGLAVGAGLGFTKQVRHKVAVPPPPPPAALTDALARQRRLLAGYDAVLGGHYGGWPAVAPALGRRRARRRAARAAGALSRLADRSDQSVRIVGSDRFRRTGRLGWPDPVRPGQTGSAGPAASATGSATAAGTTLVQLAAATAADARALTGAALAWPAGEQHAVEVVPTLASIAACLASHAQVLA